MAYKKKVKKQQPRNVETVVAHVSSSFNNTMVSVTTPDGDVILRGSAGQLGFKGARKGTPFAATQVANTLAKAMVDMGVRLVKVLQSILLICCDIFIIALLL